MILSIYFLGELSYKFNLEEKNLVQEEIDTLLVGFWWLQRDIQTRLFLLFLLDQRRMVVIGWL